MLPAAARVALAALLLAQPRDGAELLAQAFPPDAALGAISEEQLHDVVIEALPPPPSVVVRETRYYGVVTIDHRKHLARRARCVTCHDPGPVTKLKLEPRIAHQRCVGCHREEAKGPTACKECHVRKEPSPETVAAPCAPVEPAKPTGTAAAQASALAVFDQAIHEESAAGGVLGKEAFHGWLEVGLAAGRGQGPAVRVASHLNFVAVTQSVERMMSASEARTLGLLGAGLSRPIHSRVSVEALALAGFDAVDRPAVAFLPAAGARVGLEWRPRFRFLQQVTASVSGVADLSHRRVLDRVVGGTTIYGTVSTGFTFPPR